MADDRQELQDLRRLAELERRESAVASMAAPRVSPQEVEQVLSDVNAQVGPLQAFMIGAGRGLTTIGRGLGLAEPEYPMVTAAFQGLKQQRPIATGAGEITGEVAPFMVPGIGIGAIGGAGFRTAAGSLLGATEAGLITRGQGGDAGETTRNAILGGVVGGAAEVFMPMLTSAAGSLVRRVTGSQPRGSLFDNSGRPSAELQSALDKMGMTMQDLQQETVFAMQRLPAGTDPTQAARSARFESLGIPATAGNITQDFGQQAAEERLASMAGGPAGEPIRQAMMQQSQVFRAGVEGLVDSLGVPQDVGVTIKDALTGRLADLTSRKNALYSEFASNVSDATQMPVFTDAIETAIPTRQELRRVSRLPGNSVDALQDLLVEFGVVKNDEAVESFIRSGGEITPLNLANFEDFRQALNQMSDANTPGGRATGNIVGRIKGALDQEVDAIEQGLLAADSVDASFIEPLRNARAMVSSMKKEFSPESIVGRLVNAKRDGVTPIIEASRVYDSLMAKSVPLEYLERTVESLGKSPRGKEAISALQAETVMRALDNALKAPSMKTSGVQTISYPQFIRSLESVGKDRLDLIFKDKPRELARLMMFKETARDIMPAAGATPRGSAPVILDIMNRIGRAPGIAAGVDALKFIVNAGADERAVRRAMQSRPQVRVMIGQLQRDFPALATALGVSTIVVDEDQQ